MEKVKVEDQKEHLYSSMIIEPQVRQAVPASKFVVLKG